MFSPEIYVGNITRILREKWGERLLYVGLQGSYLRGEATEDSDIDVVVLVEDLTVSDLDFYRSVIDSLDDPQKSCGFICGREEMQRWNPLEICSFRHGTKDFYGKIEDFLPPYTAEDLRNFIKMSLGNLYHEITHRYLHASREENVRALPFTYKGVFFILQCMHYQNSGEFVLTKKELLAKLTGMDHDVLACSLRMTAGEPFEWDSAFSLLLAWSRQALRSV